MKCVCGEEMELLYSNRIDCCESGCCETYVRFYQCLTCKLVKIEEK
jgi:hypothetical protein